MVKHCSCCDDYGYLLAVLVPLERVKVVYLAADDLSGGAHLDIPCPCCNEEDEVEE